jgi:hypothetical protein
VHAMQPPQRNARPLCVAPVSFLAGAEAISKLPFQEKPSQCTLLKGAVGARIFWILTSQFWSLYATRNLCECLKLWKIVLAFFENEKLVPVFYEGFYSFPVSSAVRSACSPWFRLSTLLAHRCAAAPGAVVRQVPAAGGAAAGAASGWIQAAHLLSVDHSAVSVSQSVSHSDARLRVCVCARACVSFEGVCRWVHKLVGR